jgi:DNA-binding IclR family transcriptional regulator
MAKQAGLGRDGAQVVHKVLSLLKEVSASRGRGTKLTALAEAAGLPVPTAHRLLAALLAERAVERHEATRGFRLGPLLWEFGLAAAPDVDIRRFCAPALDRIAAATGDSAYVNCRSDNDALCLDRREGSYPIQARPIAIGNRRPLGVGATSLAVLASMPSNEVDAVLDANATRYRRHGLTTERVRSAVEATRARGFAVSTGRIVARFRGVALAIGNGVGGVPVALSVIAIEERLDLARIETTVALLRREEQALRALLASEPVIQQKGSMP